MKINAISTTSIILSLLGTSSSFTPNSSNGSFVQRLSNKDYEHGSSTTSLQMGITLFGSQGME
jgi:hypothetical protein